MWHRRESCRRATRTAIGRSGRRNGLATRGDEESLADLVTLLHRDGRLVIPDSSGTDPVHIVYTMGIAP